MKSNQKYLPKYWCVHDKNTDDIFIDTCSKSYKDAENKWLTKYAFEYFNKILPDDELEELYYESDNLEVLLIELNIATKI